MLRLVMRCTFTIVSDTYLNREPALSRLAPKSFLLMHLSQNGSDPKISLSAGGGI